MAGPKPSDLLTVCFGAPEWANKDLHAAAYSTAWNSAGFACEGIRYRFITPRILGWTDDHAHLLRFAWPAYLAATAYQGWAIYMETPAIIFRSPREIFTDNGHSDGWHVREDGKDHVSLCQLGPTYGLPQIKELPGWSPVDLERMREGSGRLFRTIKDHWGTEDEYRHGESKSVYWRSRPPTGKDSSIHATWVARAEADRAND